MRHRSLLALWVLPLGLSGCGQDDQGALPEPDSGPTCPEGEECTLVEPGPEAEQDLRGALIDAQPGDLIYITAGTYEIERQLSLDVEGVTIRGDGMSETVLSFANQTSGAEGLLVTGDDFTVEDLAVEDTAGDGIKVNGTTGVTFRRVRMEWTGGPSDENGAYGLYPVQCENVLIEDSVVKGASDAGIYVGQSRNIIVRNNTAEENVAGIEIENSFDADVYGNVATNNTGGVLVFNLPGLEVQNGTTIRVYENVIAENNTPNFAAGGIVRQVPGGTGIAMIAAHGVEVFENEIRDNVTVNAGVVSYFVAESEFDDDSYDPYSDTIFFHDNEFSGGGDDPQGDLGGLLFGALSGLLEGDPVPDIVWDGMADPDKLDGEQLAAEYRICIQEAEGVTFGNIDLGNLFGGDEHAPSLDITPHDCEHDPLPEVTLP